jgi:hypothetical protein
MRSRTSSGLSSNDEQSLVVAAIIEHARRYRSGRGSSYPAARTASVTRAAWA